MIYLFTSVIILYLHQLEICQAELVEALNFSIVKTALTRLRQAQADRCKILYHCQNFFIALPLMFPALRDEFRSDKGKRLLQL